MEELSKPKSYVKFTGVFKELKGDGWKFWKAFARNYRVYQKTTDGKEYGPTIYIWQHFRGYVELEDLHSLSYVVFEAIKNKKYLEWRNRDGVYWLFLNKKQHYLVDYHVQNPRANILYNVKSTEKDIKEYSNTWRECNICDHTIKEIESMFEKGMIDIVPFSEFPQHLRR